MHLYTQIMRYYNGSYYEIIVFIDLFAVKGNVIKNTTSVKGD